MSWVELYSNDVFTKSQLEKRRELHIATKYPAYKSAEVRRKTIADLRSKQQITAGEDDIYESYVAGINIEYDQAVIDNELLKKAIIYETAERRLSKYILSKGREEVKEIQEIRDEVTGEIIQEAIVGVVGIAPLLETIEVSIYDDQGEQTGVVTIDNPAVVKDVEERVVAQHVVDNVVDGVFDLAALRTPKEKKL